MIRFDGMANNIGKYPYLAHLYLRVNEYLADGKQAELATLADAVVSFCIVLERLLKIRLYNQNPILLFHSSQLKADGAILAIVMEKEVSIETICITDVIERFNTIFPSVFTEYELQALQDIFNSRNHLVHSYKGDSNVLEDGDLLAKMGTIWDKISAITVDVFGSSPLKRSKPRKKYSETELKEILIKELREKIKNHPQTYDGPGFSYDVESYAYEAPNIWRSEMKCPRCRSLSLIREHGPSTYDFIRELAFIPGTQPEGIYKCGSCHLELTKREYELLQEAGEIR